MLVMLSGIVIVTNPSQPSKVLSAIALTLLGIVMLVKPSQP